MHCSSVVIADSHPVVLQGLMSVLRPENGFKVVASCTDGRKCIDAIRSLAPDIALLDLSLSGLSGLEILAIANSESLSTRLVFFTASVEDRELIELSAGGAHGLILKNVALEIFLKSLRHVADGRRLWPLSLSEQPLSREQREIANSENVLTVLTDRERQIMRLVSEGLSNKEIGRRLNIVDGTIKVHLHNIFQKLEISNRTVLAALAMSEIDGAGITPANQVRRFRRNEQRS